MHLTNAEFQQWNKQRTFMWFRELQREKPEKLEEVDVKLLEGAGFDGEALLSTTEEKLRADGLSRSSATFIASEVAKISGPCNGLLFHLIGIDLDTSSPQALHESIMSSNWSVPLKKDLRIPHKVICFCSSEWCSWLKTCRTFLLLSEMSASQTFSRS